MSLENKKEICKKYENFPKNIIYLPLIKNCAHKTCHKKYRMEWNYESPLTVLFYNIFVYGDVYNIRLSKIHLKPCLFRYRNLKIGLFKKPFQCFVKGT